MVFLPTTSPSTAINHQAAELLNEVKRALRGKQKASIQVHLEVSVPEQEKVSDAAKLLFFYHPQVVPNTPGHCFTDIYDVHQMLRVNTATRRVQNQYFIKLLTCRLGLRPLFGLGWEHGTYYGYTRHSTASASFSYKKLVAALQELAQLPFAEPLLNVRTQHRANQKALRQKLLAHFGLNYTIACHGNFTEQELYLKTEAVAGQLCFELVAPGGYTFLLDEATYDYLTIGESWDEDDYHHHHLSQTSTEKFQAGAQYEISLSELLYVLE